MIKSVKVNNYTVSIESTEGNVVVDFLKVVPEIKDLYSIESFQQLKPSGDRIIGSEGLEFSLDELFQIGGKSKPVQHSPTFRKRVIEAATEAERRLAVRLLTHSNPILVFWIGQDREVHDAGKAHRDNPPSGDRSIFGDPQHKGFLRGRAAMIDNQLYVVVYRNAKASAILPSQKALLRSSMPNLFQAIQAKNSTVDPNDAYFVDDVGDFIDV